MPTLNKQSDGGVQLTFTELEAKILFGLVQGLFSSNDEVDFVLDDIYQSLNSVYEQECEEQEKMFGTLSLATTHEKKV